MCSQWDLSIVSALPSIFIGMSLGWPKQLVENSMVEQRSSVETGQRRSVENLSVFTLMTGMKLER